MDARPGHVGSKGFKEWHKTATAQLCKPRCGRAIRLSFHFFPKNIHAHSIGTQQAVTDLKTDMFLIVKAGRQIGGPSV
jgi:hypothetical protein